MPKPMLALDSLPSGMQYIPPGEAEGVVDKLALSGFCPVSLVKRQGMLVRADTTVGFLQVNGGAMYGFADTDVASQFARQSTEVLTGLPAVMQRFPTLIQVLGVQAAFEQFADPNQILQMLAAPVKCDFGTQTPMHFQDKNKDLNYEWNEWALRRRAIMLANLKNKRTHSTQTTDSHFRRDNQTQVRRIGLFLHFESCHGQHNMQQWLHLNACCIC